MERVLGRNEEPPDEQGGHECGGQPRQQATDPGADKNCGKEKKPYIGLDGRPKHPLQDEGNHWRQHRQKRAKPNGFFSFHIDYFGSKYGNSKYIGDLQLGSLLSSHAIGNCFACFAHERPLQDANRQSAFSETAVQKCQICWNGSRRAPQTYNLNRPSLKSVTQASTTHGS